MAHDTSDNKYTLNDFRKQIESMKDNGLLKELYAKMHRRPLDSMGEVERTYFDRFDHEREINRLRGIIDSMTPEERNNPQSIDIHRRRRIARGAGVGLADVRNLIRQFNNLATQIKELPRALARTSPLPRPATLAQGWPSTLDRLAWFPIWNRNLMLWEFVADD
jgi:signal recognition particle GTPase